MPKPKPIKDLIPKDEFSFSRVWNERPFTKADLEKDEQTNYYISEDNLAIRYKDGGIEKSLSKLRKEHNFDIVDFNADQIPHPDGDDISIFNASKRYTELTYAEEMALLRDVVEELQLLGLPLVLAENYITALLYDNKIKPTVLPTTFFYVMTNMDMRGIKNINLTTQDKEILTRGFREFFNIPAKGSIPKNFRNFWKSFKTLVLDIGKNPYRRRRNNELNLASLESRRKLTREKVDGKRTKNAVESFAEMYDRITETDNPLEALDTIQDPKKFNQKLKKRHQRLKIKPKAQSGN